MYKIRYIWKKLTYLFKKLYFFGFWEYIYDMRKEKRSVSAVFLYGELQFGNIYVKIEGSIDFL